MAEQTELEVRAAGSIAHVDASGSARGGALVTQLLEIAARPDCDPAKAREMYAFAKEVMGDEARREWTKAFMAAKADIDGTRITKQGKIVYDAKPGKEANVIKFLRYDDISQMIKPILREHGLAATYTYEFTVNPPKTVCVMKLMHGNGHIEEFRSPPLPTVDSGGGKNDVQGAGSVGTYGRRYVVCPTFDIVAEGEDDDGNLGQLSEAISDEQLMKIEDIVTECENREPGFKGRFTKWLVKEFKLTAGIGELRQGSQLQTVMAKLAEKMVALGMRKQ